MRCIYPMLKELLAHEMDVLIHHVELFSFRAENGN